MTRRFADFNNPAPPPWRWTDTFLVGLCSAIAVGAFVVPAILFLMVNPAGAQHNHSAGHGFYQEWVNGKGRGCCNDRDCGSLRDEDERTNNGKLEVRIEGQWCPVLSWHYLKKGNAPDWQTAHVCVDKTVIGDGEPDTRGPCERLLCYQPKPLF